MIDVSKIMSIEIQGDDLMTEKSYEGAARKFAEARFLYALMGFEMMAAHAESKQSWAESGEEGPSASEIAMEFVST